MAQEYLKIIEYTLRELQRYWPRGHELIQKIPLPACALPTENECFPKLQLIQLPEWAADSGVSGQILVPESLVYHGDLPEWQRIDWIHTAFWYLHGVAERAQEEKQGPIHSYSWRLKGWDSRIWERAWVNRIALFLRRWASRQMNSDEARLFGPLPQPEIVITHDLDAVRKTLAIRCKQTAFYTFNALRCLMRGDGKQFFQKGRAAARFFFSEGEYDQLRVITDLEEKHNLRSHINVYGGAGGWGRSFSQRLFDPGYSIEEVQLGVQLRSLLERGWTVGLHPSFHAWNNADVVGAELSRIQKTLDQSITSCRQHWLRFSWAMTWKAQEKAGLKLDATLGFNDRPGFRNGAALCFHPYDDCAGKPLTIKALPLVLMDSHLYDYHEFDSEERSEEIHRWIDEIRAVRGIASFLWHPHTLSRDYGWKAGYEQVLDQISRKAAAER